MYKVVRCDFCPSSDDFIEVSVVTFVESERVARRIVSVLNDNRVVGGYSFGYVESVSIKK